jgi:hypothetical protein
LGRRRSGRRWRRGGRFCGRSARDSDADIVADEKDAAAGANRRIPSVAEIVLVLVSKGGRNRSTHKSARVNVPYLSTIP